MISSGREWTDLLVLKRKTTSVRTACYRGAACLNQALISNGIRLLADCSNDIYRFIGEDDVKN